MAREERGVSLLLEDAEEGGLYQGGKAELTFEFVQNYVYKKKVGAGTKATVLLVTFKDLASKEKFEEPYGLGQVPWKVSKDGSTITAEGHTGIGRNTDTMKYMLGPLQQKLKDAKIPLPDEFSDRFNIKAFDGVVVECKRITVVRDFPDQRADSGTDQRKRGFDPSKITVMGIVEAPWVGGSTKAKKKKDDDDEEEEAPAKGKGKGKSAEPDEDVEEMATEWLIELLEDADDNEISVKDLDKAMRRAHKRDKEEQVDAVMGWLENDENLETENGWTFDGKVIALDKKKK